MLKEYLQRIHRIAKQGDAREESYYSTLESLLGEVAESVGKSGLDIRVAPKRTDAGNPDFRIWDGRQHIVGYIEAKNPTEENLERIETSDQLKRYRHTYPNLILTNFCEFRLYRNGELLHKVRITPPLFAQRLKAAPLVEREQEFFDLLEQFFAFILPKTYTAKSLAIELAKRTRFLKDQVIAQEIREESEQGSGFILGFYEAFQRYLIGTLTKEQFADLYAQTITYGLFAARTRAEDGFNRRLAFDNIPPTIGILRDVFRFISLGDPPQQMEWIVDDIAEVLAVADVKNILQQRAGRDPIVHFYEPFLAEFDPDEKERRGVYYTPDPVVSYIVGSLHCILKEVFGRLDGFASSSARVLDPAAGTCTFPAEAARIALAESTEKYGTGVRKDLIRDHILKNFHAFELMMAPYAVGHLKIGFLLEELGHRLAKDERFQLYLTNTLEMEELERTALPGMASLAEESHLAGRVKKETPILVILGNPPYSGHSANRSVKDEFIAPGQHYQKVGGSRMLKAGKKGVRLVVKTFIGKLLDDYYQVDGKPLGEKNPKWLQDDYVKFIRFAQWKIEQAGEGVLGFITNHSYLDNPTFRGMRQSLMQSFEQIYLLDLHGNSLKKERCPDGSEDKNVFDIRQGVAIGLFIKKPGLKRKIYHADLWGLHDEKYDWLEGNDIKSTKWTEIDPKSPFYLFVPRDVVLLDRYEQHPKVTKIFPVNSIGIVTSRDAFVIDFDKETLKQRIRMFRDKNLSDELIRQTFGLKDKSGWRMSTKRKTVMTDDDWEQKILPILYRPFDIRWIFYHDDVIERSRFDVMHHLLAERNLALITNRSIALDRIQHTWVTNHPTDFHIMETAHASAYVFPLYLYPDTKKEDLLSHLDQTERKPNLDPTLVRILKEAYGRETTPEEVFHYIYGVLYAPTYRTMYCDFLKADFPHVAFTRNRNVFLKLTKLGERLVNLHLLKSPELDPPISRFHGAGDNKIEKQRYSHEEKRVYLNKAQYFEGVEPEVWEYHIGGYPALDKWLKDRKGRFLNLKDITHYCRVVTAMGKTIELQAEIDMLYLEVEKDTLNFRTP